jgi:hypothetical protein
LHAIANVDDDLMTDSEAEAAAALFNANVGTQESATAPTHLVNTSRLEPVIDMTDDAVDEERVIPNLDAEQDLLAELAERHKLGLLETIDDTYMAFRTLLGETIDGKEDMFIPHSFTINVVYLLFRRSDPFNLLVKNYEEKQDKMMEKQEERCKKEMEYLKQKLKENLHEDTKGMVKFMTEENASKEEELINLKMDHKRLHLQHTLLASDHELMKMKYSATSENAPSSFEQYQCQIDDWHNKYNAKDADVKLLTCHHDPRTTSACASL